MVKKRMNYKKIKQELIDNYAKGRSDELNEILTVGAGEMVRFIKKIIRRTKT